MKTTFIAEISSNHHRDLERCFRFIDTAAEIGCDAVKFQLFRVDRLFAPEILAVSEEHRRRREWELPVKFLPELAAACDHHGIQFACTPFDLEGVEQLKDTVAFFKIASYELPWKDLLRAAARTGKPVILSTGMAALEEVCDAANTLREAGCRDLTLLHCSSAYPTPPEQANLAAIAQIRDAAGCNVGWSDHTRTPAVLHRAVHRWQAKVVELHLDLEGEGAEFQAGHCWLPEEIEPVIRDIRMGFSGDGNGIKEPNAAELPDRDWRADPEDGLRPMKKIRAEWVAAQRRRGTA